MRFLLPLSYRMLILASSLLAVQHVKGFRQFSQPIRYPKYTDDTVGIPRPTLKIRRRLSTQWIFAKHATWPIRLLTGSAVPFHEVPFSRDLPVEETTTKSLGQSWLAKSRKGNTNPAKNPLRLVSLRPLQTALLLSVLFFIPKPSWASSFEAALQPSLSVTMQLQLTSRLITAALLGAVIGKERSGKHHPAGVRTMCLVSLGASMFTLCSIFGFSGSYDTSRMASNIASGVGFIGAGVITTNPMPKEDNTITDGSFVHGLTTAAAIWLSAAVGVGCGVGMAVLSAAAAALTIAILRVGQVAQRLHDTRQKKDDDDVSLPVLAQQRIPERKEVLKEPLRPKPEPNLLYDHWNETDMAP